MRSLPKCLFLSVALATWVLPGGLIAQDHITAAIPGDFADPSIIRAGNQYYAIGTSSEWAPHFPVYISSNLKDWKQSGYVFDRAPEWTSGSFWAPEYFFHKGTYFVYYTARRKKDGTSYIGVATSKYPDREFKDHGVIIEHGKEAIDAFVFNEGGQLYITFKAYGLDKRPIEILGSRLSDDGLKLEGELFTMLKDEEGVGIEGQSILKKDDYYYLFYSAGNCCGPKCDYNVQVARSNRLQGPYERYAKNPILQENADWKCSGHGTFVTGTDGKYYYLHHAYNKVSTVFVGRQGLLAELVWPGKNNWPLFKTISSHKPHQDITDSFNDKKLGLRWQWDFRNSTPTVKQLDGDLQLSGSYKKEDKTGIVLAVRPEAIGFEATTTVVNQNQALKGLAYYGDANAAIGIGTINKEVVSWMVKDTQRLILANVSIIDKQPVQLKISLMPDLTTRFFYRQGLGSWNQLAADAKVSAEFLPQWDRSPRIGLHYKGEPGQEAVFSSFELKYNE